MKYEEKNPIKLLSLRKKKDIFIPVSEAFSLCKALDIEQPFEIKRDEKDKSFLNVYFSMSNHINKILWDRQNLPLFIGLHPILDEAISYTLQDIDVNLEVVHVMSNPCNKIKVTFNVNKCTMT